MHELILSEEDLRLVHALQIAPRVSWSRASEILGIGQHTVAQRWSRLRESGAAWITAGPGAVHGDLTMAVIEVDCAPGQRRATIDALCLDPRVVTVEESTQGRDLMLTALTATFKEMTAFLTEELPDTRGLAAARPYLSTAVYREGASWRLNSLNPAQVAAFETEARSIRRRPQIPPPRDAWPLIEALAVDGRRSAVEVAAATGRNPSTVRRQLPRLMSSGLLSFRCEVAHSASGWPISCTLRCRVPPTHLAQTVDALAEMPEVRLCMSTTGSTNLIITFWARSLRNVLGHEVRLAKTLPWIEIVDSGVNLRTHKRFGWMLDADGHATGRVIAPTALRLR